MTLQITLLHAAISTGSRGAPAGRRDAGRRRRRARGRTARRRSSRRRRTATVGSCQQQVEPLGCISSRVRVEWNRPGAHGPRACSSAPRRPRTPADHSRDGWRPGRTNAVENHHDIDRRLKRALVNDGLPQLRRCRAARNSALTPVTRGEAEQADRRERANRSSVLRWEMSLENACYVNPS